MGNKSVRYSLTDIYGKTTGPFGQDFTGDKADDNLAAWHADFAETHPGVEVEVTDNAANDATAAEAQAVVDDQAAKDAAELAAFRASAAAQETPNA